MSIPCNTQELSPYPFVDEWVAPVSEDGSWNDSDEEIDTDSVAGDDEPDQAVVDEIVRQISAPSPPQPSSDNPFLASP